MAYFIVWGFINAIQTLMGYNDNIMGYNGIWRFPEMVVPPDGLC